MFYWIAAESGERYYETFVYIAFGAGRLNVDGAADQLAVGGAQIFIDIKADGDREGNTCGNDDSRFRARHAADAHGNGAAANKGNHMITWGQQDAASAMYVVEAEKYITDVIFFIDDIEEIEAADEVAPAVKGIFDLFGRRIETPAATGIYIVDGKKTVIKK